MLHAVAIRWSSSITLCRICSADNNCFVHSCSRLNRQSSVVSLSSLSRFSSSNYTSHNSPSHTVPLASSINAPASNKRVSMHSGPYSFARRSATHASSFLFSRNNTRAFYASRHNAIHHLVPNRHLRAQRVLHRLLDLAQNLLRLVAQPVLRIERTREQQVLHSLRSVYASHTPPPHTRLRRNRHHIALTHCRRVAHASTNLAHHLILSSRTHTHLTQDIT